jgi:hypothetical protein
MKLLKKVKTIYEIPKEYMLYVIGDGGNGSSGILCLRINSI